MIVRNLQDILKEVSTTYPIVTVTGPRQSGKTTLCRGVFPHLEYVNLELPANRTFATQDPRGFLREYSQGAILDEIQRVPELTSYLQVEVDEDPAFGRFILTGSHNFAVREAVSQSLAGRTAILELMPLTLEEYRRFPDCPTDRFDLMLAGGYPAIPHRKADPARWLIDYTTNYVERDVRRVQNIGDLAAFQGFMALCAGRSGQLLNLSALGADAGISHMTARQWLSVLEAGYIVFRMTPWFANINKRLVKTPKLYFYDTGLVCSLLGITTRQQLMLHPLRGAIFENWVVGEIRKTVYNSGWRPRHHFFRDRSGFEVDLYLPDLDGPRAVEVKSGETISSSYFKALFKLRKLLNQPDLSLSLIYGGDKSYQHSGVNIVPWDQASTLA